MAEDNTSDQTIDIDQTMVIDQYDTVHDPVINELDERRLVGTKRTHSRMAGFSIADFAAQFKPYLPIPAPTTHKPLSLPQPLESWCKFMGIDASMLHEHEHKYDPVELALVCGKACLGAVGVQILDDDEEIYRCHVKSTYQESFQSSMPRNYMGLMSLVLEVLWLWLAREDPWSISIDRVKNVRGIHSNIIQWILTNLNESQEFLPEN